MKVHAARSAMTVKLSLLIFLVLWGGGVGSIHMRGCGHSRARYQAQKKRSMSAAGVHPSANVNPIPLP
jgi:hypothetical protein